MHNNDFHWMINNIDFVVNSRGCSKKLFQERDISDSSSKLLQVSGGFEKIFEIFTVKITRPIACFFNGTYVTKKILISF